MGFMLKEILDNEVHEFPFNLSITAGEYRLAHAIDGEIDLIDCYRLAVDFGRPAAEKAIAILNASLHASKDLAAPDVAVTVPDQAR